MVMMLSISVIRRLQISGGIRSFVSGKKKCRQTDLKMLGCFVINLLNNKTIILLNLAEYRLILAVSDDIPRDIAG